MLDLEGQSRTPDHYESTQKRLILETPPKPERLNRQHGEERG